MTIDTLLADTTWLGHDTFRITGRKTLYTDPWRIDARGPADLILITHDHFDHCSARDVARIATPESIILAPPSCALKLPRHRITPVRPGDRLTAAGIEVEVVAAYNLTRRFHPKWYGGVGFVFTVGGVRIYHAGDTDLIPEMNGIEADVALLPIGGTYTMDPFEAAMSLRHIRPKVAIPMHYASPVVGYRHQAHRFQDLACVPVEILPQGSESPKGGDSEEG